MTALRSCLYFGSVTHVRARPRRHRLDYRLFWLGLDLDEAPALDGRLRLFSVNRRNLLSFHEADHGDGRTPLAAWVRGTLARAGIDAGGGRIILVCQPRVLGYVFNPISIYYCTGRDGRPSAVLYEVNSTFGDRHTYLFAIDPATEGVFSHACAKRMHVSPFIGMAARYAFRTAPPADVLRLAIRETDAEGVLLTATMHGARRPLDDRSIAAALARFPLSTMKVMAGIHWEALKLWLKGAPFHRRPAPPPAAVSVASWPKAPE
ncbi:MAG: DUF1365 domain-containing protein [Rhodospirillales bacterium]